MGVLTKNYHEVCQFQDDHGIYSQASKENVQTCQLPQQKKGNTKWLWAVWGKWQSSTTNELQLWDKIGQNPREWKILTCIHSTSLTAISQEAQHCNPALFRINASIGYINNEFIHVYTETWSQIVELGNHSKLDCHICPHLNN